MSWLFSRYSASELAGVTQGAVFPSGVLNFLMLPHERSSVGVSVFAWAPVLPCLSHGWGQQKFYKRQKIRVTLIIEGNKENR